MTIKCKEEIRKEVIQMGRCRNCHTHFWGNPHFCPSCKTDLWYEEYNDENWDFRALQEEGNRLIAKGNYEKAAVVLKLALDQVMYKHAQHSMHRLKDAVSPPLPLIFQ